MAKQGHTRKKSTRKIRDRTPELIVTHEKINMSDPLVTWNETVDIDPKNAPYFNVIFSYSVSSLGNNRSARTRNSTSTHAQKVIPTRRNMQSEPRKMLGDVICVQSSFLTFTKGTPGFSATKVQQDGTHRSVPTNHSVSNASQAPKGSTSCALDSDDPSEVENEVKVLGHLCGSSILTRAAREVKTVAGRLC
eukprot:756779-Hanusia_phi.AAC.2